MALNKSYFPKFDQCHDVCFERLNLIFHITCDGHKFLHYFVQKHICGEATQSTTRCHYLSVQCILLPLSFIMGPINTSVYMFVLKHWLPMVCLVSCKEIFSVQSPPLNAYAHICSEIIFVYKVIGNLFSIVCALKSICLFHLINFKKTACICQTNHFMMYYSLWYRQHLRAKSWSLKNDINFVTNSRW